MRMRLLLHLHKHASTVVYSVSMNTTQHWRSGRVTTHTWLQPALAGASWQLVGRALWVRLVVRAGEALKVVAPPDVRAAGVDARVCRVMGAARIHVVERALAPVPTGCGSGPRRHLLFADAVQRLTSCASVGGRVIVVVGPSVAANANPIGEHIGEPLRPASRAAVRAHVVRVALALASAVVADTVLARRGACDVGHVACGAD